MHLSSDLLVFSVFCQGTRTIIDNVDIVWGSPLEVTPISTRYEDVWDCAVTILRDEGVAGSYKGFGAVLLQYGLQYAMLRLTKALCDWLVREVFSGGHPAAPPTRRGGRTHAATFNLFGAPPLAADGRGR